jgi:hypothetical protein
MSMTPTPFDKWYAANCLLAKVTGKEALRAAWNGAVMEAERVCMKVSRAGGEDEAVRCGAGVRELTETRQ